MNKQEKIAEVLTRGVENIYPNKEALEEVLKSGKKLRLYCGYDATAPSLHIGHAITLRKLRQFQDLGHEVIFLLGDFTSMIGDPTDKTAARKKLTRQEVLENMKSYKEQASKIIDFGGKNPAKVMRNSEWNDKLTYIELIELASYFTHGQMIARDMFQERMKQDKPIFLHEFLYPLTQAYDSVAMGVDLEVGGNDQTFNMLCGRDLIKAVKNKEKFVLTTKLLIDSSGKKMSKSEGNVINLNESPNNMFGLVMSWPDELIFSGFELLTDADLEKAKEATRKNPRDAKAKLAREIVKAFHGSAQADESEEEFSRIFKQKRKPSEMPVFKAKKCAYLVIDLLVMTELCRSKAEARRLIKQGGVKIDDQEVSDWREEITIKDNMTVQVGKRKFVKINYGPKSQKNETTILP